MNRKKILKRKKGLNLKALSSAALKEVVRELNSKERELEWITIKRNPFRGNITRPQSRCKGSKTKTVSVTEQNYSHLQLPVKENELSNDSPKKEASLQPN